MTQIWWVNQTTKIDRRVANEVVWSPAGEKEYWHWATMWEVVPGDIILHYTDQYIVAVSEANNVAIPSANPFVDEVEDEWGQEGKRIDVSLQRLEVPIAKTDIPLEARKEAYKNKGPFHLNGERVKEGYFFPVPQVLWAALNEIAGLRDLESNTAVEKLTLEIQGATDAERLSLVRREQYHLRNYLLQRRELRCGICGQSMPARYLHAAHIKKRSDATEKERKDIENIAMWACTLGCDQAFECGDIYITPDGTIALSSSDRNFLVQTFGHLEGQEAPAFNTENAHYFAARNNTLLKSSKFEKFRKQKQQS